MEADFTFSSVISNTSAASVVLISSMSHSVKLSVIVRADVRPLPVACESPSLKLAVPDSVKEANRSMGSPSLYDIGSDS